MSMISKEMIRHMATNDIVYVRGIQYYKRGAVSDVTWSKASHTYRANVMGNNSYSVTIDVSDRDHIKYNCNCPSKISKPGACKHIVAALLFLEHYFLKNQERRLENSNQRNTARIINYFKEQNVPKIVAQEYHLKVNLHLPAILSDEGKERAYLSLSAGNGHFYKIQNIKKFLSDYAEGNNIRLGKDFYFAGGESRFSKNAEKILKYLLEIYEIHHSFGNVSNSSLFSRNGIALTKQMLKKLLPLLGNNYFYINLFGNEHAGVQFAEGNPDVVFSVKEKKDALVLDFLEQHPITAMSEDGSILFSEEKIYLPDEDFMVNYVPFYNSLGRGKEPLVFEGEARQGFMENVFPKLLETMEVKLPDNFEKQCIKEPLIINLYLDRDKLNITARVEFQYGKACINPLEKNESFDFVVLREHEKESEFISELFDLHFVKHYSVFALKDEDDIYDFINSDLKGLSEKCRLFISSDFKKLNRPVPGKFKSDVRYHMEDSVFDVEMGFEDIDEEDLEELFNSIRIRKKYHRLKDGSFLSLTSEKMQLPLKLIEKISVNRKDIQGNHVRLPGYEALFLNYYLKEQEGTELTGDSYYYGLIDSLENKTEKNYDIPAVIKAKMRDYQVTGFSWLCMLADYDFGGILADDMGLGKTLQSICFMAKAAIENKGPSLVVCPTSLIYNWQEEFEKFAPDIKTVLVTGTPSQREKLINKYGKSHVLITSYPLIRKDIQHYEGIDFYSVFIDEAQFIKNLKSMNAKSVKSLHAKHRFALTGTPIENSLSELWSIFDFILPRYLFSHNKFLLQYEKPIVKDENSRKMNELSMKIAPFILRRMKKDVLLELPDKVETNLLSDMTKEQRLVYRAYLKQAKKELEPELKEDEKTLKVLSVLMRLRQICCHPSTFMENYKGESGKLEQLIEVTENTLESGHRMLIFSQFTSMLHIIENVFKEKKISYFYLDGETPSALRTQYAQRFNEGENQVFLISLRAGGTGLNLTGADTVIIYDPWWNPAVEEQASDRAYRIGQEHKVQVIKLVAKNSIEEKILRLKELKKNLSDSVLSEEVFLNKLSKEELMELFSE